MWHNYKTSIGTFWIRKNRHDKGKFILGVEQRRLCLSCRSPEDAALYAHHEFKYLKKKNSQPIGEDVPSDISRWNKGRPIGV
jgi:hypothetical protein